MPKYSPGSVGFGLFHSPHGKSHQTLVLLSALIAASIGLFLPPVSLEQQFWLILIPVGVFGLSHGGADPWIIRRLTGKGASEIGRALFLYALAAAAFVGLIFASPLTALSAFLLLSIWHFGMTDEAYLSAQRNRLLLWLSGSLPIVGPVAGHPAQTAELFAWLVNLQPQTLVETLSLIAPFLAGFWLLGLIVLAVRQRPGVSGKTVCELLLVASALTLLPPLLAFAFHFCVIHSVRHFMAINDNRTDGLPIAKHVAILAHRVWPATVAAIAMALVAWTLLALWEPGPDLLVQAVRVMFWGLAALTLPHSFLVHFWWRKD